MSEDPVTPTSSNALSYNEYAYAENNPVNLVDPTGNNANALLGLNVFDEIPGFGEVIVGASLVYLAYEGFNQISLDKHPWNELPTSGDHPFAPPADKAGNPILKKGSQGGALDNQGNEWTWDRGAAANGNPHWDVQHPNGEHTNVNPESSSNPGAVNHGKNRFRK